MFNMTPQMQEYKKQLEKQLPIVCGHAVSAYLDTHMLLHPEVYKHLKSDTHIFWYSFYAIRNRTILSVKKLIEPSGKNKINLDSIVKIITKPDCKYLPDKEKGYLTQWFDRVQKSESAIRLKKFRDAISHNLPDGDNVMIVYNDVIHAIEDILELLERLYWDVLGKTPYFFEETKHIAKVLSTDYWEFVGNAAKKSPTRKYELARLNRLLQGQF